jgi:hypothetical protein
MAQVPPSQDAFLRVFGAPEPRQFGRVSESWAQRVSLRMGEVDEHIAVDGKTSRRGGSAAKGKCALHEWLLSQDRCNDLGRSVAAQGERTNERDGRDVDRDHALRRQRAALTGRARRSARSRQLGHRERVALGPRHGRLRKPSASPRQEHRRQHDHPPALRSQHRQASPDPQARRSQLTKAHKFRPRAPHPPPPRRRRPTASR